MAGGAAKKAASRKRTATLVYVGSALAVNALYFALHLLVFKEPLSPRWWTASLALVALYVMAVYTLIDAAGMDRTPEAAFDLFALAVLVQLGSLYSHRAWWLLLAVPAYIVYAFGAPFLGFVARNRTEIAQEDAARAAALAGGEKGSADDAMDAKRKRRQEHKEKTRGTVTRR
jgi:hypothetical protein